MLVTVTCERVTLSLMNQERFHNLKDNNTLPVVSHLALLSMKLCLFKIIFRGIPMDFQWTLLLFCNYLMYNFPLSQSMPLVKDNKLKTGLICMHVKLVVHGKTYPNGLLLTNRFCSNVLL